MSGETFTQIPKQGAVIAIDGPAGTGKSSVTRRLAESLKFVHVDTGALYRAVALLTLGRKKLGSYSGEAELAIEVAKSVHLEFQRQPGKNPANRILANGVDVTDQIRTPEVTMASSRISSIPEVRTALLGLQRRLGCAGKTILEGRDIGTVIFPDADVKFFLTATLDERAKRRLAELEAAGADAPSFAEIKVQIQERDYNDMNRSIAPLRKSEDAIEIDTSTLTLDQVVKQMEEVVKSRLKSSHV